MKLSDERIEPIIDYGPCLCGIGVDDKCHYRATGKDNRCDECRDVEHRPPPRRT